MSHWKWSVLAASAVVGAMVLTAVWGGSASAQSPTPTAVRPATPAPPSPTAAAGGPTPPTRFYGTVTLDGRPAPDGTITGLIGSASCGTGQISGGTYVVDVASAYTRPGCGTDGATVSFMVGSVRATTTGTFATGQFVSLNISAQTPTPTPAPTASPTPARTPSPSPTAVRTPSPSPTAVRTPSPSPAPTVTRTPTAAPTAQRPAAAGPAPALPRTGAETSGSGSSLWLVLAALASVGAGTVAIARRRR